MKRIFMFLLILFGMLTSANAFEATGQDLAYWKMDNNTADSVGSRTLTINGPVGSNNAIINKSYSFDGVNDYITSSSLSLNNVDQVSFNFWVNATALTAGEYFFEQDISGAATARMSMETSSNLLLETYNGITFGITRASMASMSAGQWHMITFTYDGGANQTIWIDGVRINSTPVTGSLAGDTNVFNIGAAQGGGGPFGYFDGNIYEFFVTLRHLNTQNITDLYNSGIGCQYDFSACAPPANATPTINATFNEFYNTENISVNLTTTGLVDMKYNLDGGSNISICTNCNNATLFLFNLSDATHTINLIANDSNGESIVNHNFTVDTIAPVINNNILAEYFAYTIDFNSSCTDTNLDYCNITLNSQTVSLNSTSFTSTLSGNISYNITAFDLAGNSATGSGVTLINPLRYFSFSDNGTLVTNFTFNNQLWMGDTATIETYSEGLVLGENTLEFNKLGYANQNVTFNISTSDNTNLTTNVTRSKIILRIFDRSTNELLIGLTTITIQATQGFNGTTTTGLLNISDINFISEQYQILAEHAGYESETAFFNYNNQENINIDIYMLNSSAADKGTIQLIVKNSLSQFVESAICSALEWRPSQSAFVSVAQGLTNVNGETLLNIELNTKIYKFSCTKESFTTVTNAQIIQVDLSTLNIVLNDVILAPTPLFENIRTNITNTTINATHQSITYTFTDSDGLTTEGCLKIYLQNGNRRNFAQESCISSSTGSIILSVDINQTSSIVAQGVLSTTSVSDYVTDELLFKGNTDISFQLQRYGIDILVPLIFILLGLGIGILAANIELGVVLMGAFSWMASSLVPTVLSTNISLFVTVFVMLMLFGGFKRK